MHDSRLIKLLKTLQQKELKRLLKFLKSPYYNANPRVVRLYKYLRKDHPDYTSARMNKERAFSRLFPDRAFDYSTLTNLMSDLSRLVEAYLIVLEYEREDYERERMLTRAFGRRNAYAFFEKQTKEMLTDLEEQPYRDIFYYQRSMELMHDYFFHARTEKYKGKIDYPEVIMERLDHYFMLSKLQIGLELKSREKVLSRSYTVNWLEEVIRKNEELKASEHPLLFLYVKLLRLFDGSNLGPKHFSMLIDQFTELLPEIPESERHFAFQQLLNHSIRQINTGNTEFTQDTLRLYKIGLELGCLMDNELIDEGSFANIVSIAGALKEFEWAAWFIREYSSFLEGSIRENVQRLCYAGLHFQKGDFNETISYLQDYEFTMVLHQIKARTLLVRSWYEAFQLDDAQYDFLMAQIEAFEKFLRRNEQISAPTKKRHINFVKVLKGLMKARSQVNPQRLSSTQLTLSLNASAQIVLRGWLEEKIKEIG